MHRQAMRGTNTARWRNVTAEDFLPLDRRSIFQHSNLRFPVCFALGVLVI